MPRPSTIPFSLAGATGSNAQMAQAYGAVGGALNPLGQQGPFGSASAFGFGGAAGGDGSGSPGGGGGAAGQGGGGASAGGSSGAGSGGAGSNGGGNASGGGLNGGLNPSCGSERSGMGGSGGNISTNCMTCEQLNTCICPDPDVPGADPEAPEGLGPPTCTVNR